MPVDETPVVGDRVAKFLIEALLGDGAMGNVYRARHVDFDQVVALKVLRRELAALPSFVERFHREAKTAFQIVHPNIVRVIDFGIDSEEGAYLAMELLEGQNLASIICEERPLATERIVHLMRQALAGVAAAHAGGVVHRDLKPENIMVTRFTDDEGTPSELVKVCDFGIAKLTNDDPYAEPRIGAPLNGLLVGTPEYMAPEYAGGETIDARADVYAMGVVLYELLTGRVPFRAGSAKATVYRAMSTTPPAPSSIAPVDPQLEAICLRALEKDPAMRFASARAMRAALGSVLDPNAPSVEGNGTSSILPPPVEPFALRPESIAAHALQTLPAKAPSTPTRALRAGAAVGFLGLAVFAFGISFADRAHDQSIGSAASSQTMRERAPIAKSISSVAMDLVHSNPIRMDPVAIKRRTSASKHAIAKASAPALTKNDLTPPPPFAAPTTPNVEAKPGEAKPGEAPPVVSTLVASSVPSNDVSTREPAPEKVDPSRGRVRIAGIAHETGVLRKNVHTAMTRILPMFATCYRTGLQVAAFAGNAVLHVETDTAGVVVRARVSMPFAPTISACVEHAARGVTLSDVDTGDAEADVTLAFDIAQ